MKLFFTNARGNSGAVKQREIDIKGKCTITNYDTRTDKSEASEYLTVSVDGESSSIMEGNEQHDTQIVNLDDKKYSIFSAIAALDGDNKTLTQKDIAIAKDIYTNQGDDWDSLAENGIEQIRYDSRAGVATIVVDDGSVLGIDFETTLEKVRKFFGLKSYNEIYKEQTEQEAEYFSVIGESGLVLELTEDAFKSVQMRRNRLEEGILKLLDLYKEEGDESSDVISSKQILALLKDLFSYDSSGDKTMSPVEIQTFIDARAVKDINVSDVINFLNKISETKILNNLCNSRRRKLDITNLSPEILTSVIEDYKVEKNTSLVKKLCKSSKKNKNLQALRDGLIVRAEQCNLDKSYIDEFINNFGTSKKADVLDSIVEDFVSKLIPKEKLYVANKNAIIDMMAGKKINGENICSDLCNDDLNAMADKIIRYSNKYRLEGHLAEYLSSKNEDVKKLVKDILSSGLLDYWPVFISAIISQETGFRETGKIYYGGGNGVMQLTKSMIDDMYTRPKEYDADLLSGLKDRYPNSDSLYDEIVTNPDNIELHYELGVVGLRFKVKDVLRMIEDGKMQTQMSKNNKGKSAVVDNTTKLLEAGAMWYNSNSGMTNFVDPVYGKKTKVRADYARNVVVRFKQHTPPELTDSYFEWNPIIEKYVVKA